MTLVLIVHDHQPVGNFEDVFRQAYDEAYEPFLGFLERHPRVRLGLHTSGPLLEWLARHRRQYLERLRALVSRGQVEPWGGGFFEPVLISIPEADRRGQIEAMAERLERELGRRPRGLWLTERVWEPELAASLAAAGVEYVAVDDAHFVASGLAREELWGYYQTEDQGLAVKVFPIHGELRYAIPFRPPEQTVDLLRRVAEGGDRRIAVLGDDGEKFGVWPGTHALCYGERWLERFAEALEAHPWIELRTPAEAIERHPPLGLAYLPTASYHEMQEWALPPAAQARYRCAAERLEPAFGAEALDLLRGGTWRNFLARYPESNRPHQRIQRASRMLRERDDPDRERWKRALWHLWRAQCNDAFWHGVFGGLYLPHLRSAMYRELIAAETHVCAAGPRVERGDLDLDGAEDALLESAEWAAWLSSRGGAVWGLDDRRRPWNCCDALARRPEAYHARLRQAALGGGEGETIHGPLRLKEPGLAALVENYDTRPRDSFLDRWDEGGDGHDWGGERFGFVSAAPAEVALVAEESGAPRIEKRFSLGSEGGFEVGYTLSSARARAGTLVVELNLGLHVPEAADRYVELDGRPARPPHFAARARHAGVSRAAFVDRFEDRRLEIATDREATLERAPIETVSLSEGGAERLFQGLEARFSFTAALEPGTPWRLRFSIASGPAEPKARARPAARP